MRVKVKKAVKSQAILIRRTFKNTFYGYSTIPSGILQLF